MQTDILDGLLYADKNASSEAKCKRPWIKFHNYVITLMMRSLPELQKPVWHSEDSVQMSGSEMETSLTPAAILPTLSVVRPGLEVIKLFFKLSSAEHEISTAHKC